jgi:hypothetical protein
MKVGDVVERVYTVPGDPPSIIYGPKCKVVDIDRSGFIYVWLNGESVGPYPQTQFRQVH